MALVWGIGIPKDIGLYTASLIRALVGGRREPIGLGAYILFALRNPNEWWSPIGTEYSDTIGQQR